MSSSNFDCCLSIFDDCSPFDVSIDGNKPPDFKVRYAAIATSPARPLFAPEYKYGDDALFEMALIES